MSGILGEIAAGKSLVEDLYRFTCRLKNAGVDIGDLDLKLRNDWLLLVRYHRVLDQRILLLRDHEINHLRDYFSAISRLLQGSVEKIEWYEKRGKPGKLIWSVFGHEIKDRQMKTAEWLGGLMGWIVVVDADYRMLASVPGGCLQNVRHQQQLDQSPQQAGLSNTNNIIPAGFKDMLKRRKHEKVSTRTSSLSPFDQLIKDHDTSTSVGYHVPHPQSQLEPLRRTTSRGTAWHNVCSGSNLPLNDIRGVGRQDCVSSEQTGLETRLPANGELIGSGSYGKVYKVEVSPTIPPSRTTQSKTRSNRQFAVKRFRSSDSQNFKNEYAALQHLRYHPHRHIMPLLGAWEENSTGNLLFPLAQGDLRSLLLNVWPTSDTRTEQWVLTEMTGIASACNSLHGRSGWHHDLKPENILLYHNENEGGTRWMLSDFGSSSFRSDIDKTEDPAPVASSFPRKLKTHRSMSSHRGTDVYRPPEAWCSSNLDAPADMWALGCTFLEVLAWYLQPGGYTPQGFHQSRVHTIHEDGDTQVEDRTSAKYWMLDHSVGPILHPSVRQWLNDIKSLARSSDWLLDVPYHIERLLSITPETRMTAADLETILQHGLTLKKMALGDSPGPYGVLDGGPLPKADFSPDILRTSSSAVPNVRQEETAQVRRFSNSNSNPLSCKRSSEEPAGTARGPSLRKSGKWTRDEVRDRYLEYG